VGEENIGLIYGTSLEFKSLFWNLPNLKVYSGFKGVYWNFKERAWNLRDCCGFKGLFWNLPNLKVYSGYKGIFLKLRD